MLARRLIACLDVRDGQVVKGVHFEHVRAAGDPAAADAGRPRGARRPGRDGGLDTGAAAHAARRALALYEAKGSVVGATEARRLVVQGEVMSS